MHTLNITTELFWLLWLSSFVIWYMLWQFCLSISQRSKKLLFAISEHFCYEASADVLVYSRHEMTYTGWTKNYTR